MQIPAAFFNPSNGLHIVCGLNHLPNYYTDVPGPHQHSVGGWKSKYPFILTFSSQFIFNLFTKNTADSFFSTSVSLFTFCYLLQVANKFARGTRQRRKLQRPWQIYEGTRHSCSYIHPIPSCLNGDHRQGLKHGCSLNELCCAVLFELRQMRSSLDVQSEIS